MSKLLSLSLAPMMDRTTAPFRYLARLLYPELVLYTEMVSAEAIIHGDRSWLLQADREEAPLVLQIGCSEPEHARHALHIANDYPFSAYNLNVGCPSERVQHRLIGAALMAEPERVVEILQAMRHGSSRPISIKQRIGIQSQQLDLSSYHHLLQFTRRIAPYVDLCIVHARIAILEGLSPKENREIPPLRYHDVAQLQQDLPQLAIELNGGIYSLEQLQQQQRQFSRLMLGRWPWDDSWALAQLGCRYGSTAAALTRKQVIQRYLQWLDRQPLSRRPCSYWLNPLHNLFHRQARSRHWRRALSAPAIHATQDPRPAIARALALLPEELLSQPVSEAR